MPPRRAALLALLLVAGATLAILAVRLGRPPGPPRIVVLVTIDTLRADHLGAYGYSRETSPFLDRLAREGRLFERMISASSHTGPSHASLLTGLAPGQHGLLANGSTIAEPPAGAAPIRTLGQALPELGYETLAVSAITTLKSLVATFDSGSYNDKRPGGEWRPGNRVPGRLKAREVVDRAIAWLTPRQAQGRLFLWLHVFDPHQPYAPPRELLERFLPKNREQALETAAWAAATFGARADTYPGGEVELALRFANYDAEIAFVDQQLARLYAHFEDNGLLADSAFVITADHGEGLGSHGVDEHDPALFQEQIRVPFLVHAPGRVAAGRDAGIASHLDVFPTLVEWLGGTPSQPMGLGGLSLLPRLLRGETGPHRLAFSERRRWQEPGPDRGPMYAVQDGELKYVVREQGPHLFFDLAGDPGETQRASDREALGPALEERARALRRAHHGERAGWAAGAEPDAAVLEELKALGYVR